MTTTLPDLQTPKALMEAGLHNVLQRLQDQHEFTDEQLDALPLFWWGATNKQIAQALGISKSIVVQWKKDRTFRAAIIEGRVAKRQALVEAIATTTVQALNVLWKTLVWEPGSLDRNKLREQQANARFLVEHAAEKKKGARGPTREPNLDVRDDTFDLIAQYVEV